MHSRLLFCVNKLGTAQWTIIVIVQPSHDTLIMEDVVAVILLGPTLGPRKENTLQHVDMNLGVEHHSVEANKKTARQ